jgi:hypothetical protein
MARRQKLNVFQNEHKIPAQPGSDRFGEIFYASAEGTIWYVTRSGVTACLSDILNADPVPATPERHAADCPAGRPGRDGRDGESIVGPQGPKGEKGESIVGPQGPRGDVLIPNESELAAAVIELRQQKARAQAAFLQAIFDAESMQQSQARTHVLAKLNQVKLDAGL